MTSWLLLVGVVLLAYMLPEKHTIMMTIALPLTKTRNPRNLLLLAGLKVLPVLKLSLALYVYCLELLRLGGLTYAFLTPALDDYAANRSKADVFTTCKIYLPWVQTISKLLGIMLKGFWRSMVLSKSLKQVSIFDIILLGTESGAWPLAVGETPTRGLGGACLSLVTHLKANPQFLKDLESFAIRFWIPGKTKDKSGSVKKQERCYRILIDFHPILRGLISVPMYFPGTPYARAVKGRRRISSVIKATLEERKKEKSENPSHDKNDMLEKLLYLDTLSLDEKVSFALDRLISGYETTSKILSLLVHFLSQSPATLKKLKLEHKKIRGMKEDEVSLTLEEVKKMEFTQNVNARGNTVHQYLNRKALTDVRFKDYVIPSGWQVLPVFSAVHLDNSLHANASQFDPRRWEDQEQKSKNFFPFGGGVRYCPGSEAGRIELAVFLHHLVHNFRWKAEHVDQPVAYPYVDFQMGLPLTVESINKTDYAPKMVGYDNIVLLNSWDQSVR
ncbi:hypothetical protein POM88_017371 [Heracleum sosnowskyi]|uniref:Cytochrome P450 n=1 Tax=Heracleum sosnowskyi TaxID=360622 RepID=A0AAD8MZA1_9APIA|nr:hypothetical protein POM88_017371 [Heracleum sosnowskyi]